MKIEEKDMAYPWRASRGPGDPAKVEARPLQGRCVLTAVGPRRVFEPSPAAAAGGERAGLSGPLVAGDGRAS